MEQRAANKLDHAGRAPLLDDLPNDLIVVGEAAAREFTRGTKKLKEQIEPMALGLAEAKRRYPANVAFGEWLKGSAYVEVSHQDRAALIKLGENWDDEIAARFAELDSYSPELIARKLFYDNRNTDEGENGDDDGDSGLYPPRITRSNEAWDTIDPRLVKSLVEAIPSLIGLMAWEPAAGCGTMVDQLEASGVKVFAATDIEPRRDDVTPFDFLNATEMIPGTTIIITNPPWGRLAAPFVRHALKLAEASKAMVAMLLPLPWITGRKVSDLTGGHGFDTMVVPRYRARWMTEAEEAELEDGPQAPKMNHVWLVWNFDRDAGAEPVIRFVDGPPDETALNDDVEATA